ncbi:hypothetical protein OPQ81_011817 [Rhizoctonia solani]|nr:hypothetical protein OPQ81_011817 [Rhizoctonia solani]
MSEVAEESGSSDPPVIQRRESPNNQESGSRKKSRKSAIMEALRRGASQIDGAPAPSRQMSTVAFQLNSRSASPQRQNRSKSPATVPKSSVSPTGLPFYSHTESLDLSSLPSLSISQVKYLRDTDQANYAVAQLIDRMEPPPGSRWRGVVGFDMEWTVGVGMVPRKTGLIQLSDTSTILLIQISSMESFPHRLKELITSATILKVGVNIGADMKKLCRDFGSSYAARGVLDLSYLARAVDVGLAGTRIEDLDSSRATLGVGIPKSADLPQTGDLPEPVVNGELSDGDGTPVQSENEPTTPANNQGTNQLVGSGRRLIALARLVRRYLARELDKSDVRTSNWEKLLSTEQKQYAANDAHAGLALYYALRKVHSRSVAEGIIPVRSPPPWEVPSNDTTEAPSSGPRPAPPPFRAQVKTRKTTEEKFVPTSELQNLTPVQLEALIPWDSLIKDLQTEFEDARAAVLVKRKKEGVDLKGRGDAVVAAIEAAAVVQQEEGTSLAHTPDSNSDAPVKESTLNPLGKTYYDNGHPGNTLSSIKRISYVNNGRQAYQESTSDALGKKWPPTRAFTPRSGETLSHTPSSTTSSVAKSVSEIEPPEDSDEADSQPQESFRPPMPARSTSSPIPSAPRLASQHLRAYLLWHKQQLPLSQICASLRSARYPLAKSTVISYIVQALQADEKLPFEASRLKALVALDTTNWVRENYRQFLESKVGTIEDESQ